MKYLNCANDLHKEALHFSLECQPRFEGWIQNGGCLRGEASGSAGSVLCSDHKTCNTDLPKRLTWENLELVILENLNCFFLLASDRCLVADAPATLSLDSFSASSLFEVVAAADSDKAL
ncbi:hypothetical protein RHMOL_Rhmol09G0019100 [Rhododendron molle]|uniref:Uncharacterized protein n=4 Tax=Rhododendron molle TaxID=49168 RepID=A0ACC0M9Y5_RHOML|nr:hypothetical protein RHMOL_Rhmol09G0019100 [Rhododendron molle]KAI8537378.1 hypothetical protein RHMOL_Rhmol09G0019100 [Rhododendron molle]KAI8537379.1 hypothetical protein RHMOL_Rhmol09G0019100 [Rhododendron molle]KAI8537380.1 hypothetical protein RHMOL_Rhmol09G0019100 [Rhododendron molle]